ncbi:MAG: c-type cytochrome [Deltaproteobacteria bacterium]|nr:c-type cytochrome [Deltaproteobacteria bacterium]
MKKRGLMAVLLASLLLQTGCGSARRGEPIAGPMPPLTPAVAKGQILFERHCSQCHPGGEAGVGPAITNKPLPGFLIKFQVRRGIGAMPSFSDEHITDQQLDDLITYIKALRRHG